MAKRMKNNKKGGMSVEQAGHKGGQRVSELVEEGKQKEREEGRGSSAEGHQPSGGKRNR